MSPSHFKFGCLQFLKQKLKEQLQRTKQTERNKESRTLGLEAIAEWPFSSSKKFHFQSEAKCEAIDMKMSLNYDANKTHFHNKGFALSLVLKVRILELGKGLLCRHGRIIYYSSKQDRENGIVIVSQKINFHSFSFQIAVYLTLFVIVF